MDEGKNASITIDGEEYELILTMRATREIGARYGGLEAVSDTLLKAESFEKVIIEVVWLITMLCNQGILIHNLRNPDQKRPLLTEEKVELLTTPSDIVGFRDAILDSMAKGVNRAIENEPDPKNVENG